MRIFGKCQPPGSSRRRRRAWCESWGANFKSLLFVAKLKLLRLSSSALFLVAAGRVSFAKFLRSRRIRLRRGVASWFLRAFQFPTLEDKFSLTSRSSAISRRVLSQLEYGTTANVPHELPKLFSAGPNFVQSGKFGPWSSSLKIQT